MQELTEQERKRLVDAVRAGYGAPFIDDVEDFVWEAALCYMKGLPVSSIRNKKLFDVVDPTKGIGWSAKTHVTSVRVGDTFEVVIQRADIIRKGALLGFKGLSRDSDTNTLGEAVLCHWRAKVEKDAIAQGVRDMRVAFLLKARDGKRFAYYEEPISIYQPDELSWQWTDANRNGLRGILRADGSLKYRWYPNQTHVFETFMIPQDALAFSLSRKRLTLSDFVALMTERIDSIP